MMPTKISASEAQDVEFRELPRKSKDRPGYESDIDREMARGRVNITHKTLSRRNVAGSDKSKGGSVPDAMRRVLQHNLRDGDEHHRTPPERIDRSLSGGNRVLAGPASVEAAMMLFGDTLASVGAELPSAVHGGFGIEAIVFAGRLDPDVFFPAALEWIRKDWPGCPMLSAADHRDELAPHLHATLLPLRGGVLRAGEMQLGKDSFGHRQTRFLEWAATRFGPIVLEGHGGRRIITFGDFAASHGAGGADGFPRENGPDGFPRKTNVINHSHEHSLTSVFLGKTDPKSFSLNEENQPLKDPPPSPSAAELHSMREELQAARQALGTCRAELQSMRAELRIAHNRLAVEVDARSRAESAALEALDHAPSASPDDFLAETLTEARAAVVGAMATPSPALLALHAARGVLPPGGEQPEGPPEAPRTPDPVPTPCPAPENAASAVPGPPPGKPETGPIPGNPWAAIASASGREPITHLSPDEFRARAMVMCPHDNRGVESLTQRIFRPAEYAAEHRRVGYVYMPSTSPVTRKMHEAGLMVGNLPPLGKTVVWGAHA